MVEPPISTRAAQVSKSVPLPLKLPIAIIVFLVAFFAIAAIRLGTDATPDFRIYHYYNGFSAFHDRTSLDIVPAQLQTMVFNGVDALNYSIFKLFNSYPNIINIILSVPYSIAAICTFILGRMFLSTPGTLSVLVCAAVALFGLTGAGELPTLATAMTDVTADVPFLVGLVYWFSREREGRNGVGSTLLSGLLAGTSVGLKLTTVPFFIGFFVSIGVRQMFGVKTAWREAVLFGLVGVIAFLLIDLHWLLYNIHTYGNPIMPNMNNIFKSDFVSHNDWIDTRFMPKSVLMAVFYPAYWAFRRSQDTIELPMRDPRILIGCLSSLVIVGVSVYRKLISHGQERESTPTDPLALYLAILFLVAYGLWEKEWSIYRYLAIDECLSGLMLLAALRVCLRSASLTSLAVLFAIVTVPAVVTTRYPWWSRALPASQAVSVSLPTIAPDAMVIFLDPYAYSYLVPFMPLTVQVVGANNNIIHPGAWGQLQAKAAAAINGHNGPFWGMEFPQAFPGFADSTLAFYHLRRVPKACVIVQSNIEDGPHIRMCRLARS